MQYMSTAFTIRCDDSLLAAIKAHAEEAGESLTRYVLTALSLRMDPPVVGKPAPIPVIEELPSDDAREMYEPPTQPPAEMARLKQELRNKVYPPEKAAIVAHPSSTGRRHTFEVPDIGKQACKHPVNFRIGTFCSYCRSELK
jgi:hypothetical protein